jgi:hypothetical protein
MKQVRRFLTMLFEPFQTIVVKKCWKKNHFFVLKEGADVPSVPSTDHLVSENRYK